MGKLINRIPGSRLLISSLPVSALRTHVEHSASLAMSTSVLKALSGKLDIKRHSPSALYVLSNVCLRGNISDCSQPAKVLVKYHKMSQFSLLQI